MDDYKARFANPYTAAERGYIDDVIVPHETRPKLIAALRAADQARARPEAQARQHPAWKMCSRPPGCFDARRTGATNRRFRPSGVR
jgi:hypothetical protein